MQGVKIIAPPIFALLALNADDEILPSQYTKDIKSLGFDGHYLDIPNALTCAKVPQGQLLLVVRSQGKA
jgi:hypothetical protein